MLNENNKKKKIIYTICFCYIKFKSKQNWSMVLEIWTLTTFEEEAGLMPRIEHESIYSTFIWIVIAYDNL